MNFLLFQPEILTDDDRVYKNGQLLNGSPEYSATYDKIVSLFEKVGNNNYPWLGKYDGFYVVRGLFNKKDEKGRTLSFLFASNSNDVKTELQELSCKIGYEVSDSTFQTIDHFMGSAKKKQLINRIAIPVSIILLITLIILLCSH